MSDIVRATQAHLRIYRGVSRTWRISMFVDLGGGTVLGQPGYTPVQGPAEDWTTHPLLIAAIAPAAGLLAGQEPVQVDATWYTLNPAEATLSITAEHIESALELVANRGDQRLLWTMKARPNVSPVTNEALLAHGLLRITQTALTPDLTP